MRFGLMILIFAWVGMFVATARAQLPQAAPAARQEHWEPAGWGGGGFYWAAAFDPARAGVIYMSGDVDGVYKTEDHGQHWRLVNNGLTHYIVYSLAVDPQHPDTVYAATTGGLCKSIDGGEHWTFLPKTGPKDLHITGERRRSYGCIAVDPSDSAVVYAASPAGKLYKSADGGETWKAAYEMPMAAESNDALRAQFGKVNGNVFGGFWIPLTIPAGLNSDQVRGLAFDFQAEGALKPNVVLVQLTTKDGGRYRSKNLGALFSRNDWQDVALSAGDFSVDPEFAKKHADQAKAMPPTPDWASVNRMDFGVVGNLGAQSDVTRFKTISLVLDKEGADRRVIVKDFAKDKTCHPYGNVHLGSPKPGGIYNVAVNPRRPAMVAAATAGNGIVLSQDAGATWTPLPTPKTATSIAFAVDRDGIVYGTFAGDGVWKSTDGGRTWSDCSKGLNDKCSMTRVVVNPRNADDVYAIGSQGWSGFFYASHDGGGTWKQVHGFTTDPADPTNNSTTPKGAAMSTLSDLAISPVDPSELFIAANWSPVISRDAGKTFTECDRGADITCYHDIRFHNGRVYASAMDSGTFASDDNGKSWRHLWPLKFSQEISGHNWRLAITGQAGAEHVIATCSPWNSRLPNRIIVSEDGGKTFKIAKAGLPDYRPKSNTMWGEGFARALAVDPNHPKVVYLGIDGDPSSGNSGGGIFKSIDGGYTWAQLAHQPASRRMFYGLAVDPTDSNRLYWGACGKDGGVYRSEDGGESWQHVFKDETWIFNLLVSTDGTVYCPGNDLWRSTDHGQTWKNLTHFKTRENIVGLEVDPRDPKTVWLSRVTWGAGSEGGVYKTNDGGVTWKDITGDLPYRKPLILRFNPDTRELWAGGVGLFKLKQ